LDLQNLDFIQKLNANFTDSPDAGEHIRFISGYLCPSIA